MGPRGGDVSTPLDPLEGDLLTGPARVPGSNKSFELWVTGALSAKGESSRMIAAREHVHAERARDHALHRGAAGADPRRLAGTLCRGDGCCLCS